MGSSNLARLVDVVGAASDMEPAEGRAWLEDQLGSEPALLREALTLLEAGTREDQFLSTQYSHRSDGLSIPGFHLQRLLGEGGMGSVYLARQENPRRLVALKILSLGLATPRAIERFHYEVHALAALRHPGIAHVYETGVHTVGTGALVRELPWFAMEYVEDARSIVAYCTEEALPRRDRLALFAKVCNAVQHGHQKGVLHRDLKPDNILVGGDGRPRVIDFGVARVIDDEALLTTIGTRDSEIAGTLPYMAPERVAGREGADDVRSDVYALGVVLYQLLTNALPIPMSGTDVVTAARRAAEDAPIRPSERVGALKGDLEAILLTALEKDPARRYPTADALARDVRRYLESRPIEARPPGTLYQLRLLARRRMPLVAAIGAVLAVSLAAAAVSTVYALKSRDAEQLAEARRERADVLFETHLGRSFDTVTTLAPRIARLANGNQVAREMVERLQRDLAVLQPLAGNDPRARFLMGVGHHRLGEILGGGSYAVLRQHEEAERHFRTALNIFETLEREGHPEADAFAIVDLQLDLARLLGFRKQQEKAAAFLAKVEERLRDLPAEDARTPFAHAMHGNVLASFALRTGEYEVAQVRAEESIAAYQKISAGTTDFRHVHAAIWAYDTLANALSRQGERERALEVYDEALRLVAGFDPEPGDAYTHRRDAFRIGAGASTIAAGLGALGKQRRYAHEALAVLKDLRTDAPHDRTCLPRACMLLIDLANTGEKQAEQATDPSAKRAELEYARSSLQQGLGLYEGSRKPAGKYWVKYMRDRLATVDKKLAALDG